MLESLDPCFYIDLPSLVLVKVVFYFTSNKNTIIRGKKLDGKWKFAKMLLH